MKIVTAMAGLTVTLRRTKMIKMVKAKDITPGMTISTDGLIVQGVRDHMGRLGKLEVTGIAHGVFKSGMFNPEDELPIYYDDSNSPED